MGDEVSSCLYLIQNLSRFFPFCGLSYADLVAGQGVDPLARVICSGKFCSLYFVFFHVCSLDGCAQVKLIPFFFLGGTAQMMQMILWIVFPTSSMEQCFRVSAWPCWFHVLGHCINHWHLDLFSSVMHNLFSRVLIQSFGARYLSQSPTLLSRI